METLRFGHFLDTPEGLLAQHRKRELNKFFFHIDGVEPQDKKNMPPAAKIEVQNQLLQQMLSQHRRSFRGPIALELKVATTELSPKHMQHIAKNLLDLFSTPLPELKTRRKSLLYVDDSQVTALSVVCHHGEASSEIYGVVRPMRDLLQDIALGKRGNDDGDDRDSFVDEMDFDRAIDHFTDLRDNAALYTGKIGQDAYEALLADSRRQAQEKTFSRHRLTPRDLFYLYGSKGTPSVPNLAEAWEKVFSMSPLRIQLSELPHEDGASKRWKQEIDKKLKEFQAKFAWLVNL